MKHEEASTLIGEWIDGALPAPKAAEAAAHAESCAACREDAARLRRLGPALFRAPAPADPRSTEAFVARVMSRLEEESVPAWERLLSGRWLTPALGLAVCGLAAFLWLPSTDSFDLPLDAQLVADGGGALVPSYGGYEVAP